MRQARAACSRSAAAVRGGGSPLRETAVRTKATLSPKPPAPDGHLDADKTRGVVVGPFGGVGQRNVVRDGGKPLRTLELVCALDVEHAVRRAHLERERPAVARLVHNGGSHEGDAAARRCVVHPGSDCGTAGHPTRPDPSSARNTHDL